MHPPRPCRLRKTFPPENVLRPPRRRSPMQTMRIVSSCPGIPPDSVTSRFRTAYAGGRIAPPSLYTIQPFRRRIKRKCQHGGRKNASDPFFFQDGQICWSSFAPGSQPILKYATRKQRIGKTKNRIRGGPRMRRESRCHPHKMCGWKPQTRLISA